MSILGAKIELSPDAPLHIPSMAESPPSHPYHDSDADLIICAEQNATFRVHKIILAKASGVFASMISLADNKHPNDDDFVDGIPVVPITEDRHIIRLMLDFCYPNNEPNVASQDLNDIFKLLKAMQKYEMDGLMKRVGRHLREFTVAHPLRVYAIASCFCLEETTELAARQLLQQPLWPAITQVEVPEFKYITAQSFQSLLQYHQRCGDAAAELVEDLRWIQDNHWSWFQCKTCSAGTALPTRIKNGAMTYTPRAWWMDYMRAAQKALRYRPVGSTVCDPQLLTSHLGEVRSCTTCGPAGFRHLLSFSKIFASKVDEATKNVPLKLGS